MDNFVMGFVFAIVLAIVIGLSVKRCHEPYTREYKVRCEYAGGQVIDSQCYKLPVQEIEIDIKG